MNEYAVINMAGNIGEIVAAPRRPVVPGCIVVPVTARLRAEYRRQRAVTGIGSGSCLMSPEWLARLASRYAWLYGEGNNG